MPVLADVAGKNEGKGSKVVARTARLDRETSVDYPYKRPAMCVRCTATVFFLFSA